MEDEFDDRYSIDDILPHVCFLPEAMQSTVAFLFRKPSRAAAYLSDLHDDKVELSARVTPSKTNLSLLVRVFERLCPEYDLRVDPSQ